LLGLIEGSITVLDDNFFERLLDVDGHARRIAADKEKSAGFQPSEKLSTVFLHSMLHVQLFLAIATEGQFKPGEQSVRSPGVELVFVKIVELAALVAEEYPTHRAHT